MFGLREDPWKWVGQNDYSGGENQNILTCAPNQLLVAENCQLDLEGYLVPNYAEQQFITGAYNTPRGIFFNPVTTRLYFFANTGFYTKDWSSFASSITLATCTLLDAGITSCSAATHFGNVSIFAKSAGGLFYSINGAAKVDVTIPGATPIISCAVYKNRMWALDDAGYLHFSPINDVAVWNALDVIAFTMKPLGIIVQEGGIVIPAQGGHYVLYGSSTTDFYIETVLAHDFTVGAQSMCEPGFFIGGHNIYGLNLNQIVPLISGGKQDKFFNSLPAMSTNSTIGFDYSRQRVIVNTFGPGVNRLVIDSSGAVWKGPPGATIANFCALPFNIATKSTYSYLSSIDNTFFTIVATSIYDNSNLLKIQTRHEDFGIDKSKLFRAVKVDVGAQATGVTIKYYLNRSTSPVTVLSNGTLAAGENLITFDDAARGRTFSLEISTSTSTIQIRNLQVKLRTVGNDAG
jgi:hypothetical protein